MRNKHKFLLALAFKLYIVLIGMSQVGCEGAMLEGGFWIDKGIT